MSKKPSSQPNDEALVEDEQPSENLGYDDLLDQLEAAKAEKQKAQDEALRHRAEMENIRRRAQNDISKAHKYGTEKLITALLPVIDSLEQGIAAAQDNADQKSMREGMELTLKMFQEQLAQFNVTMITPKPGDSFDSTHHEAMSMQPTDEYPADAIVIVVQKGYQLADRLLRPARVVVAKSPE